MDDGSEKKCWVIDQGPKRTLPKEVPIESQGLGEEVPDDLGAF